MRNKQKGFSLIELLIVVAIIMILAALAIPNLMRTRMGANEASAVSALRTLTTASISYSTTYGGYEQSLADLAPVPAGTPPTSTSADLVDNMLSQATPQKSGYTFVYSYSGGMYTLNANPTVPGVTGQRYFYTDQSGIIRYNPATTATVSDSPLNQ